MLVISRHIRHTAKILHLTGHNFVGKLPRNILGHISRCVSDYSV
jgi:hypothetical protein